MQIDRHTDRHPPVGPPLRPTHRSRAVLAAGLLVVLLGTGACGASDSFDSSSSEKGVAASDRRGPASGAEGGSAESDSKPAAGKSAAGSPAAPKPGAAAAVHVIRTATLDVEVRSVPKAVAAARGAAERAGGLVSEETTERVDDTHEMSHLVLRVPQDRYDAVLRELAGTGKLQSRTSNAKDVTGQVVDVESRIATQRASVVRVRDLMDKAEKLTDVVTLEGELSRRQADLESLLAQQASLKDRTSLATITLDLSEPYEDGEEPEDADTGFLDALAGGWDAFVTMLRWIAVAIGAAAPFLATAVVLLALRRLLRGRLQRRHRPAPPTAAPAPAPEAPPAP
ncbi:MULTISPECIES: DUF4349 domain-containing protein [Streptomyces]|uniref:DUF4349 domain-containing protein n=1 Tax=Streptomyces clavifer TaxID=68188 RepID=A0ABS4V3C5_9ACTN|nr:MULTISPECIES: DUF4349 domain-containing protein [Streptomyces]MBP2358301.1 hypothetical protein [Streptomyces clavifer]MDX2742041.1 DUF4349 domain-containing protein [Streptomyces sp. NRRL_B-2557]